jgi:hypothetical protein
MGSFFQHKMVDIVEQELKKLESISKTEFKYYVNTTVDLIKQDLDFIKYQFKKGYSIKSKQEQEYFKRITDNPSSEKMIDDYF